MMRIPLSRPFLTGEEMDLISEAVNSGNISGGGTYARKCQEFIEKNFGAGKAFLTPSCTDALELSMLMLDLEEGDEVIIPSYTFVSTANAVCLRKARPVFVDVRSDTLNLDEEEIEDAVTERTKAILPVHYGGIAAEMDEIIKTAERHNLYVVEDAAQGVDAGYRGRSLGSIGDMGAYSFHATKNITCGEGGALLVNDPELFEKAEICHNMGTERSKVLRGEKDRYSWIDIGSSYLLSDILSAFLYAQLLHKDDIKASRKAIYERYVNGLRDLEEAGLLQLPSMPADREPNYQSFFVLLKDGNGLNGFLKELKVKNIAACPGYVPLHLSAMGLKQGYKKGDLPVTESAAERMARLPFYTAMSVEEQTYVIEGVRDAIKKTG